MLFAFSGSFHEGAAICIRSSREGGPTLCPADYLFRSLLGFDETAMLAEPAQCVLTAPQNSFIGRVLMGGVEREWGHYTDPPPPCKCISIHC